MDPNATLRTIDQARTRRTLEAREAIADLAGWLVRGGFAPDWARHPKGTRRFKRALGEAFFSPYEAPTPEPHAA